MAASSARAAGVSECIVVGGDRDVDEVRETGISLWSRSLTPRTGKWRLEARAINQAVLCGGVHVEPGDVAIADQTGICFVRADGAENTLHRIAEVAEEEKRLRRGN